MGYKSGAGVESPLYIKCLLTLALVLPEADVERFNRQGRGLPEVRWRARLPLRGCLLVVDILIIGALRWPPAWPRLLLLVVKCSLSTWRASG